MRRIWLYALPLALTAFNPAIADAMGGGARPSVAASALADGSTDQGYGSYTYSDVLKPKGRERGDAAEQIATRMARNAATLSGRRRPMFATAATRTISACLRSTPA